MQLKNKKNNGTRIFADEADQKRIIKNASIFDLRLLSIDEVNFNPFF